MQGLRENNDAYIIMWGGEREQQLPRYNAGGEGERQERERGKRGIIML